MVKTIIVNHKEVFSEELREIIKSHKSNDDVIDIVVKGDLTILKTTNIKARIIVEGNLNTEAELIAERLEVMGSIDSWDSIVAESILCKGDIDCMHLIIVDELNCFGTINPNKSPLFVGGDILAKNIINSGKVECCGDIITSNCIIAKEITATTGVVSGKHINAQKVIAAGIIAENTKNIDTEIIGD